ncbi:hypothetical protein GE061_007984 [Apolygus lucorum]|uniref:Uncharacterized protein n=1 Tax=Apolygus lucorum TaxID=248454 RepID=A0A6A4J3B5_APOLU|nr:hypothetical protein GE061_007984 [Apolygus lucorum]
MSVKTRNPVSRSVEVIKIASVDALPKPVTGVKVLCFKQSEKATLRSHSAVTIHEFQGQEADEVWLVRLSSLVNEQIYKSAEHQVVGITRHKIKLKYYTVVDTDDLSMKLKSYITPADLIATDLKDTKGGAMEIHRDEAILLPRFETCRDTADVIYGAGYYDMPTTTIVEPVKEPEKRIPIVPGAVMPMSAQPYLCENSPENYYLEDCRFGWKGAVPRALTYDKKRPVLMTAIQDKRETSLNEVLLAFQKRNGAVPELSLDSEIDHEANVLVRNFISTAVDKSRLTLLGDFKSQPVEFNSQLIREWVESQPTGVLSKLVPDEPGLLHEWVLDQYLYMIKNKPKPPLTEEAMDEYTALQTIAYHEKLY